MAHSREQLELPAGAGETRTSSGFDDIALELGPLVGAGQMRSDAPSPLGAPRPASGAPPPASAPEAAGRVWALNGFADFSPVQSPRAEALEGGKAVADKHSSRPASFSLVASAAHSSPPPPPPMSAALPAPEAAPNSSCPAAAEVEAQEDEEGALHGQPRPGWRSQLDAAKHLITAPVQVPLASVLFSIVSAMLALLFFLLFLAHSDSWEETGCAVLLTAASASAGPSSLTLFAVRDPATMVCLGKEDHAPLVTEDSLSALLAAHPDAFEESMAQLSFTPANATDRWAISIEVKSVALNASAGVATIEVEDWERAASADAGTVYPGTEAFERQFGAGAPLGLPQLVFKLEMDELAGKGTGWADHGRRRR